MRAITPGDPNATYSPGYEHNHWYVQNKREGDVGRWAKVWGDVEQQTCGGDVNCHPPMVFFGHDAGAYFQAEPANNAIAIGLDTSCTYGYYLTIAVLHVNDVERRREYLQIDCADEEPVVIPQSEHFETVWRTTQENRLAHKPARFRLKETVSQNGYGKYSRGQANMLSVHHQEIEVYFNDSMVDSDE